MADEAKAKAEKLAAAKKRACCPGQLLSYETRSTANNQQVEALKKAKAKKEKAAKKEETQSEAGASTDAGGSTDTASKTEDDPTSIFHAIAEEEQSPTTPIDEEASGTATSNQSSRIEELEQENKRLSEQAAEAHKKWQEAQEQLSELRDEAGKDSSEDEVEKLRSHIAQLERQHTQLQAQSSRRTASISHSHSPPSDLAEELKSKSSTIETMELEISNLKAQLHRVSSGSSVEKEQIQALEEKLARTTKSLETSQRELGDLKKNLDRTTEKAIREGSSRTSAETKARALEQEVEVVKREKEEMSKKLETMEKKVSALTTLHKEHEVRSTGYRQEKETIEKESKELRAKLVAVENDNSRLKEELQLAKKRNSQGVDDDGVDELESEQRLELERKIRVLESEVFDLKRGQWRDGRRDMDAGPDGAHFTEIPLHGSSPRNRKLSMQNKHAGGIGGFLSSAATAGYKALAGLEDDEPFLEDDDEEIDAEEFRRAHAEEQMREVERVREIKRGLERWKGWRVDLVEVRRGAGEGYGEIFEV